MNTWAKCGLAAFAVILLAGAALFGAGEYLSAPVPRSVGEPPADLFATSVRIPSGRSHVAGWVARGAGRGAVLLLHGVRSDRRQMAERARWLNREGYTVLLIDLASHGESPGRRTFGAHEAEGVRAALGWLKRNLPGEKIGVIGVSLGGASVLLAKPGRQIDALVLEAVYPTIDDAVENRLGIYLGPAGRVLSPLLLHQLPLRTGVQPSALRPVDALGAVRCPVLVIGGAHDRHTVPEDTQRMADAAAAPKELWLLDNAAHVDFHAHARAAYEQRVGRFLAAHLK